MPGLELGYYLEHSLEPITGNAMPTHSLSGDYSTVVFRQLLKSRSYKWGPAAPKETLLRGSTPWPKKASTSSRVVFWHGDVPSSKYIAFPCVSFFQHWHYFITATFSYTYWGWIWNHRWYIDRRFPRQHCCQAPGPSTGNYLGNCTVAMGFPLWAFPSWSNY